VISFINYKLVIISMAIISDLKRVEFSLVIDIYYSYNFFNLLAC